MQTKLDSSLRKTEYKTILFEQSHEAENVNDLKNKFCSLLSHIENKLGHAAFAPDSVLNIPEVADEYLNTQKYQAHEVERLKTELNQWGPLCHLLADPNCLEIFVNGPEEVFIEHALKGFIRSEPFLSHWSFTRIYSEICRQAACITDLASPEASGTFKDFRLQVVAPPVAGENALFCLRRIKCKPFVSEQLVESGWCTEEQLTIAKNWVHERKNILIIGPTGVGKTSIINLLLKSAGNDRLVILEDSDEILKPNSVSIKLLTREPKECWRGFTHTDLLKIALRLRPERLVLGELRGEEAKDYLLAMSSGHDGAITSLHASNPQSALKRLELLITLGAPQWDQLFVRDLIFQTVHNIIWLGFDKNTGMRKLNGLYKLTSNEKFGITVDEVK
jgi:pilus assembly protein CpaF